MLWLKGNMFLIINLKIYTISNNQKTWEGLIKNKKSFFSEKIEKIFNYWVN
jgi:hypothetical protein